MKKLCPHLSRTLSIGLAVLVVCLSAACSVPVSGVATSVERAADDRSAGTDSAALGAGQEAKPMSEAWRQIDELVEQQEYRAALDLTGQLLEDLRAGADERSWARALIEVVQLETGLHGYETAVKRLRDEPWPRGPVARTAISLFYAQGLTTYRRAYSWEIEQRERVVADEELDLEAWTGEQLRSETNRVFGEVWSARVLLGQEPVAALAPYLEPNNYPDGIRGSLRDAVTYLWVEFLADSSLWTPRELNEIFLLDATRLINSGPERLDGPLDPGDKHPLETLTVVLADLEAWHEDQGRPEGALEARLERLRRLRAGFPEAEEVALVRQQLERIIETTDASLSWWSMAVADLAELVKAEADSWSLVRSREIALRGKAAHPSSVGGRRCANLVAAIEAPDYSLTAMQSDGPGRRSIEVRYKNLERMFFRAYRLDLVERISRSDDYDLLPGRREIEQALAGGEADVSWSVELEPTPDFAHHLSFVTPRIDAPGFFLIVSSVDPDFVGSDNLLQALVLNVTDLVVVTRQRPQRLEVTVRSGASGRALPAVGVDLYVYDWSRRGHRRVDHAQTGADGRVEFSGAGRESGYFIVADAGDEIAIDPSARAFASRSREKRRRSTLVYTDRSVYRPGQKVLWKTVTYQGRRRDGRFEVLASSSLRLELVDANGEVVERVEVRTNDFGTASGRFDIPTGRLLGAWRVRASTGGSARIRVEEYKRPTFEVAIDEPETALRMNREARLTGEARYYFGLPLAEGDVRWRVTRVPVYPRWWSWWYRTVPQAREQTIASGVSAVSREGQFALGFVPVAEERVAGGGVSYSYRVDVEVTDAGGETRSAASTFRLGFIAVEAVIESEVNFFGATAPARLSVRRTDLDGAARPGSGKWRLATLAQPAETPLPADVPILDVPAGDGSRKPYRTSGDDLRPRWAGVADPSVLLRTWDAARELARGEALHGEDGLAQVRLPLLEPGAYRLSYETEDDFGATFETQHEFVVAASEEMSLQVPIALWSERASVAVGETARLFVHSGLADQELVLELFRGEELLDRRTLNSGTDSKLVEIRIRPEHRGGIGARLSGVRDHQLLSQTTSVFVPWDDRRLELAFSTFRDTLRPGERERWSVTVKGRDEATLIEGSAELLAYMYDRSLDLFARHDPFDPGDLYPRWGQPSPVDATLGSSHPRWRSGRFASLPASPQLLGDRLQFLSGYGIGGMGRRHLRRGGVAFEAMAFEAPAAVMQERADGAVEERIVVSSDLEAQARGDGSGGEPPEGAVDVRSDFAETAFWEPHLRLDDNGSVSFEFTVPDSLTEWNVWVQALTRDLRSGRLMRRAVTSKELIVRPYLPRFLREGDRVEVRVMVSNAGEIDLEGTLDFALEDPESGADLAAEFGLQKSSTTAVPFRLAPGASESFPILLTVPVRVGEVAITARAAAGDWQDGERRALPLLPGRMHLTQSRFAALRDQDRRDLRFEQMSEAADASRMNEQLVVTVDAQLFYGILHALPYLASYPYECTEQTLNRFLSSAIVSSVYESHPVVRKMARQFSERETRLEPWVADDPNRRMALEETPWLNISRGGQDPADELVNVLDPATARREQRSALAKLEKAQTASGGFPWWPGGPPSPYMTLYLLSGFSRALEFGVDVPKPMIEAAWRYAYRHYLDEMVRRMTGDECCWELVTFLNYVLSAYPDESWTGGVFTAEDRRRMLEFSSSRWKEHSPLLKGFLALTLHRAGRSSEAELIFDSVMDSAKTERDLGTFWSPEDRAWLWYNDTIESHAFALRVLSELTPDDDRRHGLVQWLFLNKKLNHWKSTRATGEVIYALVHYLEEQGTLGAPESIRVAIGNRAAEEMIFEPDEYSGRNRQIRLAGSEIAAASDGRIVVEKETPGLAFVSATWHFSTEELPQQAEGDFFSVHRRYFKRDLVEDEWTLAPLEDGVRLASGDQVEVQLTVTAKHAAEYVHLRDPRPAGFEPEALESGYSWSLGVAWYEEVRDSGSNFFVEWLPAGEYVLKYRLRANLPGTFRAAPAHLQSMYAPEFAAYSAGKVIEIAN